MTESRDATPMPIIRVAIVLQRGADLLDIAGPAGVFHCAGRHFVWIGASEAVTYQLDYLSPEGGMVRTRQELVVGTSPLEDAEPADYDTVIVAGGIVDEQETPEIVFDWLRRCRSLVRRIGSVCVGSFILARAGLLVGRLATTHW